MNDFDYDVWQKKIIAQGARHKKNGAKSRLVTLSQDTMTRDQLIERNGPMSTFNLSKPMTWSEFRQMPKDLRCEYLSKLRDRFNASGSAVAGMLGVDKTTFREYCLGTILEDKVKHRRMSTTQEEAWRKFINQTENDEVKTANGENEPEDIGVIRVEDTPVLRAHDILEEIHPIEEPTKLPTLNRMQVELTGAPAELELGMDGVLSILPYNSHFRLRIALELIADEV